MLPAKDAPPRSALRCYGGKWNLAPWIISFFPKHDSYVEPCGGAASVLLQKPRSLIETYNDLDGNVVNFFRVLRDDARELVRRLQLTPWSREEYDLAFWESDPADPIEAARRFYVATWQGINSGTARTPNTHGWRTQTKAQDDRIAQDIDRAFSDDLLRVADRLRYVQIEQRAALEVIARYDSPTTLFYFDPPYVRGTRDHKDAYQYDWADDSPHVEAAEALRACRGSVVVSGYQCSLYASLYEAHGWTRVDKAAQTNSGGTRTESLWLSPRAEELLGRPVQMSFLNDY